MAEENNGRRRTLLVCRYWPAGNQFTGVAIRDNIPVPPRE